MRTACLLLVSLFILAPVAYAQQASPSLDAHASAAATLAQFAAPQTEAAVKESPSDITTDAAARLTPTALRQAMQTPVNAPSTPAVAPQSRSGNRTWLYVAGGAVLVAGGVLAAVLIADDDDGGSTTGFPLPPNRPSSP